jgi:hypothetical protein
MSARGGAWLVALALWCAGCGSCDGCGSETPEEGVGLQLGENDTAGRAFPNAAPPPERPSALPNYASMTVGDHELAVAVATTTGAEVSAISAGPGVTITIDPKTTLLRSAVSPAGLAVGVGAVLVERAPAEGALPAPPVRVGTLAGTLALEGPGKAYVATSDEGAVYVAVLEGDATFVMKTAEGALERRLLRAGDALTSLGREPSEARAPKTADAARAAAQRLRGASTVPDPAALAAALEADLAAVEEERAAGRALRDQRRANAGAQVSTGPSLDEQLEAHIVAMGETTAAAEVSYERAEALAARLASADASEASRYLSTLAPTAGRALPLLRR